LSRQAAYAVVALELDHHQGASELHLLTTALVGRLARLLALEAVDQRTAAVQTVAAATFAAGITRRVDVLAKHAATRGHVRTNRKALALTALVIARA
jgi:hypothetical protein